MIAIDAHLDLAYNAARGRDIRLPAAQLPADGTDIATVGLPDLRRGQVGLVCATIFADPYNEHYPQGYKTQEEAQVIAWNQMQYYLQLFKERQLDLVTSSNELPAEDFQLTESSPVPAIVLMEGADPILSPDEAITWWNLGVRAVGLAWRQTAYAGGTFCPGPLTEAGRKLVPVLDRLGFIHDASHLAEESFWDLMDLSGGPVMASHSNCREFVDTDRQISDDMIRAIARRGGVIGINFFYKFLIAPEFHGKRRANLGDVVRHMDHICQITGSDKHVAIGTDMDGGLGRNEIPQEITTAADLPKVGDALRNAGYDDAATARIMRGNWLRFFGEHLPA